MLSGLMSRWTIPAACATARAWATWAQMPVAIRQGTGSQQAAGTGRTLHVFHDQDVMPVAIAVGVFTVFMYRDDLRMVEPCEAGGLTSEAFDRARTFGQMAGDQLDRHRSPQRRLLAEPDFTHATPPEEPFDGQWADSLSWANHNGYLLTVRPAAAAPRQHPSVDCRVTTR